ncbi:LAFE_0H16028g1_1 [Lachancea fermentati]|uniref:LAFE_0H16028g1_1 n=1 Tax=Lachancea fermentati TaxID=4955 RepID=A0A1G4MKZ8_LACFM|nr:LAFE_0H16028g1_1 [Lachancea fermentati]
MFEVRLNPKLTELLKNLEGSSQAEEIIEKGSISMKTLIALHQEEWKTQSMKELLTPLEFQFKPKEEKRANYTPEFREQLHRLKLLQDESEYQEMIKRDGIAAPRSDHEPTLAQMNKQVREQVTTVINVLISVGSVVWAIWYWTGSSSRMQIHNRVLLCLFFGILVLVAEVVVYNSYLRKIEEARLRERKKKEKKKVVKKLML